MKLLVLNSGSSSVKFKLFEINGNEALVVKGAVERIGQGGALVHYTCYKEGEPAPAEQAHGQGGENQIIAGHSDAIECICQVLASKELGVIKSLKEIAAIGHRVVHGGEKFSDSVVVNDSVMEAIRECTRLAPLHNPPALLGIEACARIFPGTPQVAVFDTAFHQTLPRKAYLYGLPKELYTEHGIRKYGFHGTSHRYVAGEAAKLLGKPIEETRLITCHLGNGSSITAVERGRSIDTSMGFTPLAGVIMGTRAGDIDPYIPLFLLKELGMTIDEVDRLMNKCSGFLGICQHTDVRDIVRLAKEGDQNAELALNMFSYRVSRFIGSFAMVLGGVDAIVFTGGIGERSSLIRGRILERAGYLGVKVDAQRNKEDQSFISTADSPTAALVVPTDEELVIARDTARLLATNATEEKAAATEC
ncbi:MAG: acetate kinase [Candidatus Hydrogenedentes bacterium]|nr:acetate kinase [Candidatus Hydrogenedentota bacterium]